MTTLVGISASVALAAVALIGYLVGRQRDRHHHGVIPCEDVQRATRIVSHLESIAASLRRDLALHRSRTDRFRTGVMDAEARGDEQSWRRVRDAAQQALEPTLQLASRVSDAYEQLRLQSDALASLTGGRTDPATGLPNCRMLTVMLSSYLATRSGQAPGLSVLLLCVEPTDREGSPEDGRSLVRQAARVIESQLRSGDFAASYGPAEFVVVMPRAGVAGASQSAARLRAALMAKLPLQVSCGLTESLPGDTPRCLLSRADSAAYSARAAGGSQFVHTGAAIRPDRPAFKAGDSELPQPDVSPIVDLPSPGFVPSGR